MMTQKKETFGDKIARINPILFREAMRRQLKLFSYEPVSLPHLAILDYLGEKSSSKMSDLAKVLGISMGAVTGIVDKMIFLKLVKRERSDEDRRVVFVVLLDKGKDVSEKFNDAKRNIVNDLFSILTEKEKQDYLLLIQKVVNNIKE